MSVQTLYTAASGMRSMDNKLDVIANNLSNMETTAFKKGRANFENLIYRNEILPGAQDANSQRTTTGIAYGMGSRVQSVQTELTQGAFLNTGNELDVAIQGRGFFRVTDPNGDTYYTRAGNFSRNANGNLVVASATVGRLIEPPITIPNDATAIQISADGMVSVMQPGNPSLQQIGQIELSTFVNPEGLLKLGQNLYAQTDSSGPPTNGNPNQEGRGTLQQSVLESSNVDPVEELIDLIKTQRAFELNSQAVKAGDQILQQVANLPRSQ